MHLKTLTLRGFKSFASATTLNLEPGITCVVGPNGSGKSNVVDALAWVMGEQGAKTLRGGQMADVIFAGTSGRAPLGRAQVSLTIDNSDGALPIDYTEVTISRTLFRGGGSEYSINNNPCRLLDIQELLSDTGMGRQMHVIVGQGQLDAILSAGPMELRGFIEEAAGVLKHRRRKERALKKLDSMEANLHRVRDLANELARQLRPLARQAKAARKAAQVQAVIRDAQARLLADELQDLTERLEVANAQGEGVAKRRAEMEERMGTLKQQLAETEEQARKGAPRAQELTVIWQDLNAVNAALGTLDSVAKERVQQAAHAPTRPAVDLAQLQERSERANSEDSELLKQLEASATRLDQARKDREAAEEAAAQAQRLARRLESERAQHREQVARLVGDVQTAQQGVHSAQADMKRMEESVAGARERTTRARAAVEELGTVAPEEESGPAREHEKAVETRDRAREVVDELLATERDAQASAATWRARRDTLHRGLAPDDETALLLEDSRARGTLSQFVRVASGWENAVAALLTPFSDAVVVDDLDVVTSLSGEGARRVVIASAEPVGPDVGSERALDPVEASSEAAGSGPAQHGLEASGREERGLEGTGPEGAVAALSAVETSVEVAGVSREVLADCLLVEDLPAAVAAVRTPGVRAVATRAGDVLTRYAVRTAGRVHASVLERRAEYEVARKQTESAQAHLTDVRKKLQAAREHYDAAVKAAHQSLQAVRAADAKKAQQSERRARVLSALRAAQAEQQRLGESLETARKRARDAVQRLEAAQVRQRQVQDVPEGADPAEALERAQRCETQAKQARANETQVRLDARTLEEQSKRARDRARSLRTQLARAREQVHAYERQEQRRVRRHAALVSIVERLQGPLQAADAALNQAGEALKQAESARSEFSDRADALRKEVDARRAELIALTDEAHRDEIAKQELVLNYERVVERAQAELGLEPQALLAQYGPAVPVEAPEPYPYDREEQQQRLGRAQKELKRLGNVNPLALEEHRALEQRHQFLTDQLRDLLESKNDLLGIVDAVDAQVQEAFALAFYDTAEAFEQVFATLFPGGAGHLALTDPEDMLQTGIEISARPAGKKITRLSLLSGGERSLAAVALLVAIFKARPSPFYVMDEVEAALDDVNLSRLITIFKQLQEDSQLIIITHQKRTMRIADALYGVTMRDGVTQVVSQKLAQTPQAQADEN
ncbi:chromosome segregation SMC family protein [Gleimia hominis]|uniref:chromosome segregation SMC family protein n=1 Tax=Gleimia hominis TaxID=595468 RepID=UPI002543E09A|nr:AAA family ATPase [Gleimia hominis]WIK65326.1 AAA family ATPase [Gleimia hominis]